MENMWKYRHKSIILLISGLVVAILTITLGISQLNQSKEINRRAKEAKISFDTELFVPILSQEELDRMLQILRRSPYAFAVQVQNAYYPEEEGLAPIHACYLKGNGEIAYPMIAGRSMEAGDFEKDLPVTVAGKDLVDGISLPFMLSGREYTVIGITGYEDLEVPPYSNIRQVRLDQLPKTAVDYLLGEGGIRLAFKDAELGFLDYFNEELVKVGLSSSPVHSDTGFEVDFGSSQLAETGAFIYSMAMLNTFNISIFWINKRKKEIGIRKAYGYANVDILIMLFKEMLLIASAALAIAYILQMLITPVLERLFSLKLKTTWENLYAGLIFLLVTSTLSIIIPGWIAAKVEPADTIRGVR